MWNGWSKDSREEYTCQICHNNYLFIIVGSSYIPKLKDVYVSQYDILAFENGGVHYIYANASRP